MFQLTFLQAFSDHALFVTTPSATLGNGVYTLYSVMEWNNSCQESH